MLLSIMNWFNNLGNKLIEVILNPFLKLPEFFQFIILLVVIFLSIIGLIRVVRRAFKTVVGVACAFIVLLILWVIFI